MIQWYMKYWFYVSHIPQIKLEFGNVVFEGDRRKTKINPQSPLSWVSESFRQDIGQFHSFLHEALSIGGLFYQGLISIL